MRFERVSVSGHNYNHGSIKRAHGLIFGIVGDLRRIAPYQSATGSQRESDSTRPRSVYRRESTRDRIAAKKATPAPVGVRVAAKVAKVESR